MNLLPSKTRFTLDPMNGVIHDYKHDRDFTAADNEGVYDDGAMRWNAAVLEQKLRLNDFIDSAVVSIDGSTPASGLPKEQEPEVVAEPAAAVTTDTTDTSNAGESGQWKKKSWWQQEQERKAREAAGEQTDNGAS